MAAVCMAGLPTQHMSKVLKAVRTFAAFTPGNDPWGEHDFGKVAVDGTAYVWKIDAYDLNLEFGSPAPADKSVTRRVLTIMTEMEV